MKKTINDMIKEGKIYRTNYPNVYIESYEESKDRLDNIFVKENNKKCSDRKNGMSDVEYRDSLKKEKGLKYNQDKPMLAQFYKHFPNAYKAMVDNAMYGLKKYKENINDPNWKKNEIWEYEDALFRHFSEYLTGNLIDEESGKKHLAAVIWNAMVLYELNEIKENQ